MELVLGSRSARRYSVSSDAGCERGASGAVESGRASTESDESDERLLERERRAPPAPSLSDAPIPHAAQNHTARTIIRI